MAADQAGSITTLKLLKQEIHLTIFRPLRKNLPYSTLPVQPTVNPKWSSIPMPAIPMHIKLREDYGLIYVRMTFTGISPIWDGARQHGPAFMVHGKWAQPSLQCTSKNSRFLTFWKHLNAIILQRSVPRLRHCA